MIGPVSMIGPVCMIGGGRGRRGHRPELPGLACHSLRGGSARRWRWSDRSCEVSAAAMRRVSRVWSPGVPTSAYGDWR
jgi:hypothetical protein